MSDDDSLGSAGDDDVQVAAQISSMLKPLTKKQSKMGKRLSALEGVVAKMAAQLDEQLPQLRRAVEASTAASSETAQALRADVAQCAPKTALERRADPAAVGRRVQAARANELERKHGPRTRARDPRCHWDGRAS